MLTVVMLALILSACASSTSGGGASDAGASDASRPDASGPPDAGRQGEATGVRAVFCGGGGRSEGASGADEFIQTVIHTTCVAPADVAAQPRRQGTIRWQPGPIYVVAPP